MKFLITLVLVFYALGIFGQVIPQSRQVNWTDALLSYGFVVPVTEIDVTDFGATGDGTTNDQPAVMAAIASLNGNLGYIFFPPGNYLLRGSLYLPDSTILKGFSSNLSVLKFNFSGTSQDCIIMAGNALSVFVSIDGGYAKDSSWILSDSAFLFNTNDYVEIIEENGTWDDVPVTWAERSVGQIVQVSYRHNDTLFLESPLRITYDAALNPRVRKIDPRVNAGVECVKITRIDESNSGANIMLSMAANCHIRGIESDKSVSAHVDIFQSTQILVEGNYFHHAFLYNGASKHGYGVTLNAHSGECLVTNNIFRYLRHAMMCKTGANGNVFSYNYSREVHRSEWPFYDYGGDISLHGHYAYANLFEGNIVQNINVDHEWGPSGPNNTFFRNRAENYGIIFSAGNPLTSNNQHIIGNDITSSIGSYTITGTGHIQHGNNHHGTIKPPGTNTLNDTSYYLSDEPVFWDVTDPWPSLGIPNVPGDGTNPAKARWDQGYGYTVCPLRKDWTGSVSSDWNDPHNWEPYGVPDEAVDVTIPQSVTNDPQLPEGSVQRIRSIAIGQNSEVQIPGGATLFITK